ncbi:ATP-binding cassette domain-containing protein, partial [Leptospira santarosai]|nr:ATP-binding cassette domain-containing protein [Leptospira santarosai]
EYSKPIQSLSGGQKTRLALAKLLLTKPDLLIWMSQPTIWTLIHSAGWNVTYKDIQVQF